MRETGDGRTKCSRGGPWGHSYLKTVAIGYTRRSKESGAHTVSLDDQRERIDAYCREHGWALAEVLVDDGVSGGRRERLDRIAAAVRRARWSSTTSIVSPRRCRH